MALILGFSICEMRIAVVLAPERVTGVSCLLVVSSISIIVVKDKEGPGMWFTVQIVNSPA